MIGTKRKAGRDTAGQAFAAEGNGHFTESRRLRQLPPAAPALALRALCLLDSAFSAGCTIQAALQQVLEDTARRQEGGLAERDRHLAAELAYGTLRMENRLAFVLGKVLQQPLKLPLPLRRLLAVAAYGLLFLDRLPAHAVLHTAVDLARQLYGPGLARVVNGSLRSVQRLGDAVRTPDFYAGPADEETFFAEDAAAARKLRSLVLPEAELRLARFHAVPRWLVALWQQAYGDEACRALLARSGARPWQALRVNASRPQAATLKQAVLACVPADGPAPQAVGRWGNFVNQEAYGYAVTNPALCRFPISVYIEADGCWHLATFFYESVWCFFIVLFILLMERGGRFRQRGDAFLWYLLFYGVERAVVEGLRTDSLMLGPVRVSQVLAAILALGALVALVVRARRRKKA